MKKILVVMFLLAGLTLVVSASGNFSESLKSCSSYSENGTVKTDGIVVKSAKQILGWEKDRCVYKETIDFAGINTTITCKLNKPQINEITSVMDAYAILENYSENNVDTSSLENVQNNPVVKVWNKYLNDKSVCSITTN